MPIVAKGFVGQAQLAHAVDKARRKLGKKVVRINYSLETDSSGEPSIFFRIILPDEATIEDKLAEVTGNIATTLFNEIRPHEQWQLLPYFSFRSKSEQALRDDPEWAEHAISR